MKINIRNIPQVVAYLKTVTHGAVTIAARAIAEYIVGDGRHGLKHYPVYKYVSRIRAYGKTFVSDKQRRFVMAAIRDGRILPGYPRRTGNTQRAYKVVVKGHGHVSIQAPGKGPLYTRHNQRQARLNALAGWRKAADVVRTNIKGAMRHARAEVNKYLKQRRK